jgi:hypothetical protein
MPSTGCVAVEDDGASPHDMAEGQAGGASPAPPAFSEVYAVMERSCGGGMSGCHITGMSAGLKMPDATAALASLVNVASSKCPGELRVVPGDAEGSLLVQVLEGSTACVKPMPLGRDTLSADDLELVRTWIDDGALE